MVRVRGTFEVEFDDYDTDDLSQPAMEHGLRLMLENELFPGYEADTVEVEFIG